MTRRTFANSLSAVALCLAFAATAAAQDFQRTYNPGPGGSVVITNVSGDVNVAGHDAPGVTVTAFKEGADRDQVEVEDLSSGGRVELRAKYPRNCNCDASVRFEVRVPRSGVNIERISTASGDISARDFAGDVKLQTASGEVTVESVSGEISASSASGNVRVKEAAGTVNASTASGDVDVELTRLQGQGDLRFSTASGNVSVRMPSTLDANVSLSTASGSIETNFPLEVRSSEHGPGKSARGRLGSGSRNLRISSASGDVSLKSI